MDKEDIEHLCKDTVDYIQGVSYDNIYYSLLFMLGENMTNEKIERWMESSDNYWLKTLILNHDLLEDKYSKEKIRDMIIRRIEQACLGRLVTRGNFECIVPDPFAYMQWITGQKVDGLLKEGQMYSHFWNKREIRKVDSMRSPLTHFSEHNVVDLVKNKETEYWYQYSYTGFIVNCHDYHTLLWAGSDYDI